MREREMVNAIRGPSMVENKTHEYASDGEKAPLQRTRADAKTHIIKEEKMQGLPAAGRDLGYESQRLSAIKMGAHELGLSSASGHESSSAVTSAVDNAKAADEIARAAMQRRCAPRTAQTTMP